MIPVQYQSVIAPFLKQTPVDVSAIARALGLEIFSDNLPENVSGRIVRDAAFGTESGFAIFVDSTEPIVRQRFTAAHEIAHFLLHSHLIGDQLEDNYLLRSVGISNKQEQEANSLAADLLMPRGSLQEAINNGLSTVEELANHFNVSKIAMGIRLGLPT